MCAGGREIEVAAEGEQGVAERLRIEPAAREAGEQLVVRIARERGVATRGGKPVGARQHDLPVQGLDGPAARAELLCEVIKQLGMGRWFALFAEIVRRRHEAAAEMVLPDAIHHHASGEWIVRRQDPVGQVRPTAALGIRRQRGTAEHSEEAARHDFTAARRIAFLLHGHVGRLGGLADRVGQFKGQGLFRFIRGGLLGLLDLRLQVFLLLPGRVLECVAEPFHLPVEPGLFLLARVDYGSGLGFAARGDERHEVALLLVQFDPRPRITCAVKDAVERVVILRGDGIELVIVAARAAHGEPEEAAADVVDRVLDREVLRVVVHARAETAGVGEVAGRDDALVTLGVGRAALQVAGELIAHKLVVGQVAIEGGDDPVAVAVQLWDGVVGVVARGVGIAHDVEPVPAPAFTVTWRGEQPLDHAGERIG